MKLILTPSKEAEAQCLANYRAGKEPYKDWPYPFFMPDRMDNIGIDLPEGVSFSVYTTKGDPVCGVVVSNTKEYWKLTLPEEYQYEPA